MRFALSGGQPGGTNWERNAAFVAIGESHSYANVD